MADRYKELLGLLDSADVDVYNCARCDKLIIRIPRIGFFPNVNVCVTCEGITCVDCDEFSDNRHCDDCGSSDDSSNSEDE